MVNPPCCRPWVWTPELLMLWCVMNQMHFNLTQHARMKTVLSGGSHLSFPLNMQRTTVRRLLLLTQLLKVSKVSFIIKGNLVSVSITFGWYTPLPILCFYCLWASVSNCECYMLELGVHLQYLYKRLLCKYSVQNNLKKIITDLV